MSNFKHIATISTFLCFLFLFASCNPPAKVSEPLYVSGAEPVEKANFRRKPENRRIVVALGTSWTNRPVILKHLFAEYGTISSGGIVQILTYPEDFLVDGRVRLSILTAAASDVLVDTLITLGMPEGTVRELSRLHASRPEIHIITLFPEDEALQVEAASEFVLEQAVSTELLAVESNSALSDSDVSFLLLVAAFVSENKGETSPLVNIEKAIEKGRQITREKKAAKEWKFLSRIDPDTGLKARNHVLLDIPPSLPILEETTDDKKTGLEVENERPSSN